MVSQFEQEHDAQCIYRELKKHALASTAAQLSGDTLLQYITASRYPGDWRGTSFAFVLHWREQVMKYEKLELEDFPPKQKMRLIQNAVGDVTELAYMKQIGDQDIAQGNPPLTYESYMELLLNACSTYDKKRSLPGKQKRAVYSTAFNDSDPDYPHDPDDDIPYEAYRVDTDISDILVNASATNRFGNRIPRDEWEKLSQEERDRVFEKRRQERMANNRNGNPKQFPPPRRANLHSVEDFVDLDSMIDYAVMKHDTTPVNTDDNKLADNEGTALLPYMSGQKSSCGGVQQVLASKQQPDKNKNVQKLKVNEGASTPSSVTIDGMTYYLNKGESINIQGHNYSAHMTEFHYRVGQHDVADMEHALVDRGANGGICGSDMHIMEGVNGLWMS